MNIRKLIEHRAPGFYKFLVEKKYFIDYKKNKKLVKKKGIEALIRKLYIQYCGKEIDLENPQTFNEKLNWLKLNWYDERPSICSNKSLVREYIKQKGLEHLLIEEYAEYDSAADIDLSVLPDSFVLKPSHDSGHVIICRDKNNFDLKKAQNKLNKWLNVDYEYKSGEWPYHSKKCIVCEKFMQDYSVGELLDYKFLCFNGEPKYVFFVSDRAHHAKSDLYDMNWNLQDFLSHYEPSGKTFPRPSRFDEMKEYAKILASDFPFVRVDLYEINGKVYFGELTFFHHGGLGPFKPDSKDRELGNMLVLPPKSNPSPWEVIHPELKWDK